MFFIYLQVLVPGQAHVSCFSFGGLHSKDLRIVCYDGLDACLIVHALDEFGTCSRSRIIRLVLKSRRI
jgi:hypothetical protein